MIFLFLLQLLTRYSDARMDRQALLRAFPGASIAGSGSLQPPSAF